MGAVKTLDLLGFFGCGHGVIITNQPQIQNTNNCHHQYNRNFHDGTFSNTMYPNPISTFHTNHQKYKTPILPTPTINAPSAYTENHQKPPIKIQREGTKPPALNYSRQTQKGTSAQNQGSHQTHVRVIHKLSTLSTLSTNAAINARNAYPRGVY